MQFLENISCLEDSQDFQDHGGSWRSHLSFITYWGHFQDWQCKARHKKERLHKDQEREDYCQLECDDPCKPPLMRLLWEIPEELGRVTLIFLLVSYLQESSPILTSSHKNMHCEYGAFMSASHWSSSANICCTWMTSAAALWHWYASTIVQDCVLWQTECC